MMVTFSETKEYVVLLRKLYIAVNMMILEWVFGTVNLKQNFILKDPIHTCTELQL